jgi:hypothetical protein
MFKWLFTFDWFWKKEEFKKLLAILRRKSLIGQGFCEICRVQSVEGFKMVFKLFEKLQLLLKPRLIRCLILQLLPSIPTVNNLPILCLQFLKAVMKLSQ